MKFPSLVRSPLCWVLLTAAMAAACAGSHSDSPACVPGQSVACTGPLGCTGNQICSADGKSFASCACGQGDAGRTFPSAGEHSGLLGADCDGDGDCRSGLTCWASASTSVLGEGPSAGLCVASCAKNAKACAAVDPSSTCVTLDNNGTPADPNDDAAYCLPNCKLGPPSADSDKCRARLDLVCSETAQGARAGYCRPSCRSDIDCAPRICNLKTGLCGDAPPNGDGIGSVCDPKSSNCAGGCISHSATYAECSGVCSFGTAGCGQTRSTPPYDYFCTLDPATSSGPGDLGYCSKLCNCDADCARADAVCEPISALRSKTGRMGVCSAQTYASGELRTHLPCK